MNNGEKPRGFAIVLQVLTGVGEEAEANRLREYALDCIPDAQLRNTIMNRLSPPISQRIQ
jgi:hypothetical protein